MVPQIQVPALGHHAMDSGQKQGPMAWENGRFINTLSTARHTHGNWCDFSQGESMKTISG